MKTPHLSFAASALGAIALLLTACEGPDRKAMLEEARHSVPPMAADEAYFDGQVAVHLRLSGTGREGFDANGKEIHGSNRMTSMKDVNMTDSSFGDSMGGGMASGIQMGGSSDEKESRRAAKNGTYQGNEGMGSINQKVDEESPGERRRREAEMPGALMRLRLENTSPATVVVEIKDVNSDLGNFAVRPDTVTLNPGQTVETEPMLSKLGVESYTLPVTIVLRAAGKTEARTLTLHIVNPQPTAPTPDQSR